MKLNSTVTSSTHIRMILKPNQTQNKLLFYIKVINQKKKKNHIKKILLYYLQCQLSKSIFNLRFRSTRINSQRLIRIRSRGWKKIVCVCVIGNVLGLCGWLAVAVLCIRKTNRKRRPWTNAYDNMGYQKHLF